MHGVVERLLGPTVLSDLTEEQMREYVRRRQADGASGRTINMELGELSRAIGRTWRELWPRVKKLEQRKDLGRAISPAEQIKLLDVAATLRSPVVRAAIPLVMLTGLRSGEALHFPVRISTAFRAREASPDWDFGSVPFRCFLPSPRPQAHFLHSASGSWRSGIHHARANVI